MRAGDRVRVDGKLARVIGFDSDPPHSRPFRRRQPWVVVELDDGSRRRVHPEAVEAVEELDDE